MNIFGTDFTMLTYLGSELDTQAMEVHLPEKKFLETQTMVSSCRVNSEDIQVGNTEIQGLLQA